MILTSIFQIVRIAIGNLSCFQPTMQILFGMPEDRRKCIPSMVTIMEISVYLEISSVYKELHADRETGAADNK